MVPVALLDADVLFPMVLRDTLLRVAGTGCFRPHWSDRIIEEVVRNLVDDHRVTPDGAERLAGVMRDAFPEAMVEGWAQFEPAMTNHPKDRHVAAAAAKARASIIVTSNLKDFQSLPDGIVAMSPDAFLVQLIDADPDAVIKAVTRQAAGYRNPVVTLAGLIDWLEKVAPGFAARARMIIEKAIGR